MVTASNTIISLLEKYPKEIIRAGHYVLCTYHALHLKVIYNSENWKQPLSSQ